MEWTQPLRCDRNVKQRRFVVSRLGLWVADGPAIRWRAQKMGEIWMAYKAGAGVGALSVHDKAAAGPQVPSKH
jgi:hypothetical protein